MSELRVDMLTGRQVLLATNRAGRPSDLAPPTTSCDAATDPRSSCPFCAGSEHHTPRELWRWPLDSPQWTTRVVPNKYPAVATFESGRATDSPNCGMHEVIVESPRHCQWMRQLDDREWDSLTRAWHARLSAYAAAGYYPVFGIFKNVGLAGGASLAHVHSQGFALPWVPRDVERERGYADAYHNQHNRCVTCSAIESERNSPRIVLENDDWLAYCLPASRQAYEIRLLPKAHVADAAQSLGDDRLRASFGRVLRMLLVGLEHLLPGAGYNVLVVTQPESPAGHWRVDIVPRTASFAGLELMSGLYLCTVAPEDAAERMRAAIGEVA